MNGINSKIMNTPEHLTGSGPGTTQSEPARIPDQFSETQWRLLILFTSGLVLLFSYYCLDFGVTTIFSHLYYIPIILIAYRYHGKGVVYSLVLGLLYLLMVLWFLPTNIIEIAGALERFVVFTLVAVVVAYLSAILEKEQQEYQSLYHFNESIVSNAHVWLAVMDKKGTIAVWNKAAEEITGYTANEVIGNNRIWKLIYPNPGYRKEITATIETITREKRFFENFVTDIRAKSGEKKTISWNTRAVSDDPQTSGRFVAIGFDITKRKKAEEELQAAYGQLTAQDEELRSQYEELAHSQRALSESEAELRNILRTAMDGFCIMDANCSFIDVNDAFCTMLGYSREEMLALSIHAIDVVETPEATALRIDRTIRNGEDRFETRYRCRDGRIINVEVSVVFTPTRGGRFLTFHRNITERKRTEASLIRATTKLNLLNQITFSDLQNAIFSLSGYLELERSVATDANTRQYGDKQASIVQTINETLKFAKNYQNLGMKPPLWQNAMQSFLYGISHLDMLDVSRKIDVGDLEIYADPLLEKVFFTMTENVMLHGRTATEIALYYRESPEGLILFFEDNGAGIPGDMKEKIFERRYEQKKGMGLFLVREILSITAITIRETGEPGKGARFEIFMPKDAYRIAERKV